MKHMKKLLALMIAVVMCMAMTLTVYATGEDGGDVEPSTPEQTQTTYTITITKDTTDKVAHTYGAYQIFAGKLETVDGKPVLSDITWGTGVTGATLITELNKIDGFSIPEDATPAAVAKAIGDKNLTKDSDGAKAIANAVNAALTGTKTGEGGTIAADATTGTITGLPAGYYLVKDTADVTGEGAVTRYILEVVKDVPVTEKANVPSVIKKVKEKDDNTGNLSGWQDGADYDIGDSIPYKLEGTLPGRFAEYKTYKVYTLTDTLSAGLTPPSVADVKVTLNTEYDPDDDDVIDLVEAGIFEVTVSGQKITVKLKSDVDLRTADYNGEEEGGQFVASDKIIVTYNATLNQNAVIGSAGNPNTVKLDFTNNPNGEQDGKYGTTPEDKVIVFTYTIKALKVEPDGDAIDQTAYAALTDPEKADYVKVGEKWQKTKALNGAGFTLYKKINGVYEAVSEEITGVTTFEFKGQDAGYYKLVETTVPTGFNKADDVEIVVEAEYDTDAADPKLKSLTVTPETAGFTVTTTPVSDEDPNHITTDGIISGKILNQKGSTLPSTGGIGTTIFYVLGAILVVGAGVVLVTRRRMSA